MQFFPLYHRFWHLHDKVRFSAPETALYCFLVAECNRLRWKNPFTYTNVALCDRLSISEKTLIAARKRLQQQGLLHFKTGFRHHPTQYQLTAAGSDPNTQEIVPPILQPIESQGVVAAPSTLESRGSTLDTSSKAPHQKKADRPSASASSSEPSELRSADDSPLADPEAFAAILRRNGYSQVDMPLYRHQMLTKASDNNTRRTLPHWQAWIVKFLNNEQRSGPLLLPQTPTPTSASINLRLKANLTSYTL